ncbi:MAG TPA: tetratricopeptide repeat protein [Bryobacterales bacterium]|nr:tetratricopeptide repeat protein [Bryobacterales bacterium]
MRPALFILLAAALAAQTPSLPPDFSARVAALERSHQAGPGDLQVVDALAGSYAMAGEYQKAIALLRQAIARPGGDAQARADLQLKLARNQSWARRSRDSIRSYETYLKARPGDRTATIELIRLRRYRGDYSPAEKLCNRLLRANPDDAEVLALKAEVLHWAGNRSQEARRAADRAASLAADSPDAKVSQIYALRDLGENRQARREFRELTDEVSRRGGPDAGATYHDAYVLLENELAHPARITNTPAYSSYNDSDGIHNDLWGVRFAAPFREDHKLILDFNQYRSSAPSSGLFTAGRSVSSVTEFDAGGTFRAAPGVDFTLLGGGSQRRSAPGLAPTFDFQIAASPLDRWTFDFSSGREFLMVTPRSMDLDISSYKVAGGAQYAFDSHTSLALHAERRYWSDQNASIAADALLRRILHYHRPFMIDAGALVHWEHYARDTQFASGFFTPDEYRRYDGFMGLHGELGRWVSYEVRGAVGAQRVTQSATYRPDWELTTSANFRLSRSLRFSANYQRRNYSLLSRDGWYQGFYIGLGFQP